MTKDYGTFVIQFNDTGFSGDMVENVGCVFTMGCQYDLAYLAATVLANRKVVNGVPAGSLDYNGMGDLATRVVSCLKEIICEHRDSPGIVYMVPSANPPLAETNIIISAGYRAEDIHMSVSGKSCVSFEGTPEELLSKYDVMTGANLVGS